MAETARKGSTLLAISILALAASLVYFTFEFSRFVRQIPAVLENVRVTSEKIEPVVEEIDQVRELIPPILAEVAATREQIPPLLEEVKQVRETIPPVLEEIAKTREQIPAVLEETAAAREQLPAVLARVDAVTAEMKAYRPVAKEALVQAEALRKEIPVTLDRVDGMLDKARVTAREASSGMVTGALGGLITAPFRLVGNFGSAVLGLSGEQADEYTEKDLALLQEYGRRLISADEINASRSWENRDTRQRFRITLVKAYVEDGQECRDLLAQAWTRSVLSVDETVTVCRNDEGEWEYR